MYIINRTQRHKNFKNLIYIKNTILFKKNLVPLK